MEFGKFSEDPRTEWLSHGGDDRAMKLLADFHYTDPDGRVWMAREGRRVDGASIPEPLWSLVGSPYTGDYRRASIVHDIACDDRVDRTAADRMFYFACLCGGCSKRQAQLLYAGVRIGAWIPSIGLWSTAPAELAGEALTQDLAARSMRLTFQEIDRELQLRGDVSFDELAAIVQRQLSAKAQQTGPLF